MTEPFLVTERLRLRTFVEADIENIVALHGDPEVMRYIGRPESREEPVAEAIPRFHETRPGVGFWVAELRANGEFVGWFAVRPWQGDATECEVGYRLVRSCPAPTRARSSTP